MKTYTLIYLADSGLLTMEITYKNAPDCYMREVGSKKRLLIIDPDNAYPRLMHVCKGGRRRTVGQYPSFDLGRDWSESLQKQFAVELAQVREIAEADKVINEEAYMAAVKTLAEQLVALVRADYPCDVEMQRGMVGDYLGSTIDDIKTQIESLSGDAS